MVSFYVVYVLGFKLAQYVEAKRGHQPFLSVLTILKAVYIVIFIHYFVWSCPGSRKQSFHVVVLSRRQLSLLSGGVLAQVLSCI